MHCPTVYVSKSSLLQKYIGSFTCHSVSFYSTKGLPTKEYYLNCLHKCSNIMVNCRPISKDLHILGHTYSNTIPNKYDTDSFK